MSDISSILADINNELDLLTKNIQLAQKSQKDLAIKMQSEITKISSTLNEVLARAGKMSSLEKNITQVEKKKSRK